MTVVLILGAIAVVAAIAVGATRRRTGDERHTMQDYRQTLDTLRHISDRNPNGGSRRALDDPRAPAAPKGPPDKQARTQAPDLSLSGLLIGKSGPSGNGGTPTAENGGGDSKRTADESLQTRALRTPAHPLPSTSRRAQVLDQGAKAAAVMASTTVAKLASGGALYKHTERTLKSGPAMKEPRRRGLLGAAVFLLIAAGIVAAAVAVAPSNSHRPGAARTHTTSATHRSGGSTTGGSPHHGSTHSSTTGSTAVKNSGTSSSHSVQPTTFTATAASYAAPTGSYTLELSAVGPCWILATEQSTGQVIWTGTLQSGQSRQIPATGVLYVRLGAAFSIDLTLNGVPVTLPAGHGSPFDVTFQAA